MGQKMTVFLLSLVLAASMPLRAYAAEVSQQPADTGASVDESAEELSGTSLSLDDAGRIEQIYVNMPDLFVYGDGFGRDEASEGRAFIGQTELALDTSYPGLWEDQESGTCWYILLDISGSMPDSYFRAVKEGIQNLQDSLDEADSLVLCTFGNEVRLLADGSQSPDEMGQVLKSLDNSDQQTLLFEAIDKAAGLSAANRDDEHRRSIIAVITDGEDIATGKAQSEEALEKLSECGTPVYAFCISDTKRANINSFSEFARKSGGISRVFRAAEGGSILTDLREETDGSTVLHYMAASNLVSNNEEVFSLHMPDGTVLSRDVMMNRWQADTEAPRLVSAEAAAPEQIELIFSEALLGADNAANYRLACEGTSIGISSVTYLEGDETVVELSLRDQVSAGSYTLILSGITDVSMERNPVESSSADGAASVSGQSEIEFVLSEVPGSEKVVADSGAEGTAEESTEPGSQPGETQAGIRSIKEKAADHLQMIVVVLALLAAAVLLAVIAAVCLSKKSKAKKSSKSAAQPVTAPPGAAHPAAGAGQMYTYESCKMPAKQVKLHLADEFPVTEIRMEISVEGRETVHKTWQLEESLIVGRSSICDICIDDRRMSKQHFCLEAEGDSILISDLQSTNGTCVGGIRINNRRKINPGDIIEAGSTRIKLNW